MQNTMFLLQFFKFLFIFHQEIHQVIAWWKIVLVFLFSSKMSCSGWLFSWAISTYWDILLYQGQVKFCPFVVSLVWCSFDWRHISSSMWLWKKHVDTHRATVVQSLVVVIGFPWTTAAALSLWTSSIEMRYLQIFTALHEVKWFHLEKNPKSITMIKVYKRAS